MFSCQIIPRLASFCPLYASSQSPKNNWMQGCGSQASASLNSVDFTFQNATTVSVRWSLRRQRRESAGISQPCDQKLHRRHACCLPENPSQLAFDRSLGLVRLAACAQLPACDSNRKGCFWCNCGSCDGHNHISKPGEGKLKCKPLSGYTFAATSRTLAHTTSREAHQVQRSVWYVHASMCMYMNVHACLCTCIYMSVFVNVCVCVCTLHTYTHEYTSTHLHMHMHIHMYIHGMHVLVCMTHAIFQTVIYFICTKPWTLLRVLAGICMGKIS